MSLCTPVHHLFPAFIVFEFQMASGGNELKTLGVNDDGH